MKGTARDVSSAPGYGFVEKRVPPPKEKVGGAFLEPEPVSVFSAAEAAPRALINDIKRNVQKRKRKDTKYLIMSYQDCLVSKHIIYRIHDLFCFMFIQLVFPEFSAEIYFEMHNLVNSHCSI